MATFTVTTALDVVNAGDGLTSLREAVTSANAASDADTIVFDVALTGSTLVLTGGELLLTQDVNIDGDINGDNKADITISGNNASRIFRVNDTGTDVDLLSLTLTNGQADRGAALRLYGGTTVDILDTTIIGNAATMHGGGIYNEGGILNVTNSTISGNTATTYYSGIGGGMYLLSGTTTLVNTTVDGNSSNYYGGGIWTVSTLNLFNSTITGNQAALSYTTDSYGGGISEYGGTVNITNSVIASNTSGTAQIADDVYGAIDYAANSFIGSSESILSFGGGLPGSTINGGGDPLLAALADNGGTVQTRAVLGGSALVNAGYNALVPVGLAYDANGNTRTVSSAVDIGAVEAQLVVTTTSDTGLDNITNGTLEVDMLDGGGLSLREAVDHSIAGDEITFSNALAGQTIVLSGSQLSISNDLTIIGDSDGDNKADITISGNDVSRVFSVIGTTTVDLVSLDLTSGYTTASGGAVVGVVDTTVNIIASTIRDSNADYGGAASTFGTMNIVNSTIFGNSANDGGGLYVHIGDTLNVTNSTLYNNTAINSGGGINAHFSADLSIFNTTIAGNIAGDTAGGGGLSAQASANVTIANSVFADNIANAVADDVNGDIDTANNSFFGTVETITAGTSNINGTGGPVLLGELLDNGGPVLTMSPLDGSPVIGVGSNALIALDTFDLDQDGNTTETLPFDARGGTRILGGTVDMGAVEQFENETIFGTSANNTIVGGLGDDVLSGEGGADNIDGGGHGPNGDTVTYATATGAVQVVLDGGPATGNDAAGDVITNVENLIGSSFSDTLTGNSDANFIDGRGGADIINGLGGDDSLQGGVIADTVNGGDGNDVIFGSFGNDTLDGGADEDEVDYSGFGGNISVNLNAGPAQTSGGGGVDTITNVENARGGDFADTLTGRPNDTKLWGGAGGDKLFGLGGNDQLFGGSANDNLQGGNGDDMLFGEADQDILTGGAGNDILDGGDALDRLVGSADDDTLIGGGGRDILRGDSFDTGTMMNITGGNDTFVFNDISDSAAGGLRDIIRDLVQGEDLIDLTNIDAITGGGDDAFAFIGNTAFSGTAGELRYAFGGSHTIVSGDVDGDSTADFQIDLNGNITLLAGDFIL